MNCVIFYRTLGRFLSHESQNRVHLLLEVGGRLVLSSFQLEITFSLKVVYFSEKKALYLSVNVFSMKVIIIIGDTTFVSPAGDGWPFYMVIRAA